ASTTITTLEQYYRVFSTSAERIRTLRQNVSDATALVDAMRKSVAGGERTNTDALHAERQSYQARQALLRTYVEWFQAYAKLQFYAGRFSEEDVLVLNRHLLTEVR
ncbi:TolC family protein, partial [uncultured Comamonas sp.]